MAHIQVWRSKPAWRDLPPRERPATMSNLLSRLRTELPRDSEDGPFVIHGKDEWLIVWTDNLNRSRFALEHQYPLLAEYFEPMMTVSANSKWTARTLTEKLSP